MTARTANHLLLEMSNLHQRVAALIRYDIRYREGCRVLVRRDEGIPGRVYVQVEADRPDAITGEMGVGRGGKIYLSPHMVNGEIVRKIFQALLSYEEHECREFFRYRGAQVFGPHIDVEALVEAASKTEVRA